MRIFSDIDLSPNIQKFLPLIKTEYLFNNKYGLKHPGAIFNTSIGKVENALLDFFDSYKEFGLLKFEEAHEKHNDALLKTYKIFLYSLREYVDDCFHVIKCFIPPFQKEIDERNQFLWIRKSKDVEANDLLDEIKDYKNYLDNIVNELKHNNGILGSISLYDSENPKEHCAGYFIANVVNNRYQPVEKIHPEWNKQATGFSYRRDIFYNMYHVFYLGELVLDFIKKKTVKEMHPIVSAAPGKKKLIYEQMMLMPRYFLPDEYEKAIPSISLTQENTLKLEYPSRLSIKPNRLNRVKLTHSGDGYTREFKTLYAIKLR